MEWCTWKPLRQSSDDPLAPVTWGQSVRRRAPDLYRLVGSILRSQSERPSVRISPGRAEHVTRFWTPVSLSMLSAPQTFYDLSLQRIFSSA